MTCKDCVHVGICNSDIWFTEKGVQIQDSEKVEEDCRSFKDKSRFVELPCAKGDTVYEVIASHHSREGKVVGFHLGEFTDLRGNKRGNYLIVKYYYSIYHLEYERIGKTVFLTREEAEKALEERKEK